MSPRTRPTRKAVHRARRRWRAERAADRALGLQPRGEAASQTPTRADRIKGLKLFIAKLNSKGVTATLEPGLTLDEIGAYMEMWRAGAMTTRVRLLQRVNGLEDVAALSSVLSNWRRLAAHRRLQADERPACIEAAFWRGEYQIVVKASRMTWSSSASDPASRVAWTRSKQMFGDLAAERRWQVKAFTPSAMPPSTTIVDLMECRSNADIPAARSALLTIGEYLPADRRKRSTRSKRLGLYVTVQDYPIKLGHNMTCAGGEDRAGKRSILVRSILAKDIPVGGGTDAPVVDWETVRIPGCGG